MIVNNGYIKITTTTGGGFLNGKPQRATTIVSDFIPANVNESKRTHGIVNEQTAQTQAAYTVLIEPQAAPNLSDRDRVEIFDSRKVSLGTFEVQTARLLDFVDALMIQV